MHYVFGGGFLQPLHLYPILGETIMKLSKTAPILYVAAFILLLAIPVYTIPLFGTPGGTEKGAAAEPPQLYDADNGFNGSYSSELDEYLAESMVGRQQLISVRAKLRAATFGTSAQENVVVGKDGWLFYSETLDDFTGNGTLSDTDIQRIGKVLDLIDEYVSNTGGRFIFAAAPNKNTVYPQYMPYYYRPGSTSNLQKLGSLLGSRNYYISLTPVLKACESRVYHKTDTHWNNLGAAAAYREIMTSLGRSFTDYPAGGYYTERNFEGDLERMLCPAAREPDEQIYFNTEKPFGYSGSFHSPDDLLIRTYTGNSSGTLLMFRDSFGNALYPLMAGEFAEAQFSRVFPYRLSGLSDDPKDAVIIEIAERNLANLLSESPVFPAPVRNISDPEISALTVTELRTGQALGLTHVYGLVAEEQYTSVFIAVGHAEGTIWFEACPIAEKELLAEGNGEGCGGFSAYIDIPENEISGIAVFGIK